MFLPLCRASRDERQRRLPGDRLVPDPMGAMTHAITINTPPRAIWPLLLQFGFIQTRRYVADRTDNGEKLGVLPWLPGGRADFAVGHIVPDRAVILLKPHSRDDASVSVKASASVSWTLLLEPLTPERTRLITRARIGHDWLTDPAIEAAAGDRQLAAKRVSGLLAQLPRPLLLPVIRCAHSLVEPRVLRGIKRRAEQDWAAGQVPTERSTRGAVPR